MKRLSRTDAMSIDEAILSEAEREYNSADSPSTLPDLRWKVGYELPIFVRSNSAAVQLCQSILDGTIVEFPSCAISEAVAIMVYRLVVGQEAAEALKPSGLNGVYIILASLYHQRVVPRDESAAARLRQVLVRKASGPRPPGLDGALRVPVSPKRS